MPPGEIDAHVFSHFLPASAFVVHKLKKENELLDIDYDMYLDDAVKDVEISNHCFVDLGFGLCTNATILEVNFDDSCKSFITSNVESEQTLWNEMVEAKGSCRQAVFCLGWHIHGHWNHWDTVYSPLHQLASF
jgi:hypothetical protein